jgi:hypothetical protein
MIDLKSLSIPVLLVLPAYYYLYSRPRQIDHDAKVAKEFCPDKVRAFLGCFQQKELKFCENEMLLLHNCVYKQKGFNQVDMDFL